MMGALAFHDNGDDVGGSMGIISFATPYGFVGFNPDHIAPDVLSSSCEIYYTTALTLQPYF